MRVRLNWWIVSCVVLIVLVAAAWVAYVKVVTTSQPKAVHVLSDAKAVNSPIDPGTDLGGVPAPNVTLTDQYGQTVSLRQFRGKVVVLAFVDSECTNICPLTTQSMMDAVRMLGPRAAKDIQLIGVNANPEKTSVADVKQYSMDHGMMNAWHFLTGSAAQLKQIWHAYNIYDQIVNGQIDHTPALYIIDPEGREQVLFMTPAQYGALMPETDAVAKQIARFLPGNVRVNVKAASYQPPQVSPATTTTVPAVTASGSDEVTLGPGKPQLVAFFASWAPDVRAALADLNQYAERPGSPEVIGIDIEPVEPNRQAVLATLQGIPHSHLKIGLDETGELADGYQATDVMWFSLTDGKGHIIWSQDGWTSASQLEQAVDNKLAALR
ncbi:MAG: SCO family protein [Alicyclobacillus sp.]|nr:SCO family protein [Alicyclobacillus sp.]